MFDVNNLWDLFLQILGIMVAATPLIREKHEDSNSKIKIEGLCLLYHLQMLLQDIKNAAFPSGLILSISEEQ